MAIFASFAKPAQNGPDNGEKRILSEQDADKVFLNSVYALNYLGFALIRGDLFNPYERASKAWLGHCFIIYAIPLEGAGEFYDGMIEMRGLKAERGNSPVKTEAWLRRLAESFSGEYQLQPVVFINRQGGAKRICLKHTEITSRSEEGGERSAVIEDGGETALSGVKLHPKGDGVYIKIEDKPYACRFRLIGNSKIIAEESPGDYRGMFSGRVYYSNKFEEDYRRYFSRP